MPETRLDGILGSEEFLVRESGFERARANVFETLFTVGNGRMGTRAALEEGHRGALSGVFVSGVYDGHDSIVTDLVNAPDWVDTAVFIDGSRLDADTCQVVSHERVLDLSQGVLWRSTIFEDAQGRQTRIESLRASSMASRDVSLLRLEVTPLNHAGTVLISSGIDGERSNLEALPVYPPDRTFSPEERWAKWARSRHLEPQGTNVSDDGLLQLTTWTIGTEVTLGFAAATTVSPQPSRVDVTRSSDRITRHAWSEVGQGETVRLDKVVAVRTTRDFDAESGENVVERATQIARAAASEGVEAILARNADAWTRLWAACDAEVLGSAQFSQAVRFSIYHLLITANPDDPTVNIGAKSLSGEGYRGHVFWDTEVMMLPFFIMTQPDTARALLGYRYHTLDGARRNSAENGTKGARYAWESAATGDEECPRFTPDGTNRFWTRDEEVHVSADVAYGIHRYVEATGDVEFLQALGAEILFETSRFWVTFAERDDDGSWHLRQVMGPDEFHSHVDDNAFTNRLVQWHLRYAADVYDQMKESAAEDLDHLQDRLGLSTEEVATWREVADGIVGCAPFGEGVVEQFAGFFEREDVPVTEWDENNMPRYPKGYHHFNCETTQLLKQPDVLQLMLMYPDDFSPECKRENFEYYESRTLHKSSLSPAVHAIMGIEVGDTARAVQYFSRSALVDLTDNQGNTCEGMHIASAAGTWAVLTNGFGGLRVHHGKLTFAPWIPPEWDGVRYRITWRGAGLQVSVGHEEISLHLDGAPGETLDVQVQGSDVTLESGSTTTVALT